MLYEKDVTQSTESRSAIPEMMSYEDTLSLLGRMEEGISGVETLNLPWFCGPEGCSRCGECRSVGFRPHDGREKQRNRWHPNRPFLENTI